MSNEMSGNERQCDKDKLAAYIRGELDDRACQEVEDHAMDCDACRAEIESSVGRIAKALRESSPMVTPPEGLHARVMSAASARTKCYQRREPAELSKNTQGAGRRYDND